MQQLTFVAAGRLEWEEVARPRLGGPREALVRPVVAARCDLDLAIATGKTPFAGPFPFGHESIGIVIETGDEVQHVQPGDRVVVPFQISCGECANCRRGLTNTCLVAVPKRAMYGLGPFGGREWGGHLSEVIRVPYADHMLEKVDPSIDLVAFASLSDNIPDAYRTVAPHLEQWPGSRVLVVGGVPSISLYAVAFAAILGASEILYVDRDPKRRELAERIGATAVAESHTREHGLFPITVDASAHPKGLASALLATDSGGVCTSVGIYYAPETPVPLLEMYTRGITFITGRVNASAEIPKILALAGRAAAGLAQIPVLVADWGDAPRALLEPVPKVIVRAPDAF